MIEISTSQGRRIPRRRNSRSANQRNTALSSYFNLPGSTTSRSARTTSLPFDQHTTPAQYSEQAATSGFFNFLDFGSPSPELLGAGASIHHDSQVDSSWASSWIGLNGSASVDQVAPQLADANNISLLQDTFPPQIPSPNLQLSWDFSATNPRHASSDMGDASILETQLGSYGSFEYVTSSPNTLTSPISDGWVIPSSSNSLYGSPASPRSKHHLIQDLQLPGDYFQNVTSPNASLPSPVNAGSPLYPDMFSFEETRTGSLWTGEGDSSAWSTTNNIMTSQAPSSTFTYPWNSQDAQDSSIFGPNSHSGSVAFDPERGGPYHTFDTREEVLAANTNSNTTTGGSVTPEVLTPGSDTPSYEDTNKELQDRISSRSRSGSPWQYIAEHHPHIFSLRSGIEKAKPQRGRMRPLTVKGKKEALEVRNAGACWACHLSKVKCSPCSSGSPCEQCARLLGKRRFCHLPCFNDPIESLNTFLVPDYLTGHFTQQNVESFVQKHAVGWGSHSFRVCMTWGGRIPLVANVVALTLREDRSELSNNSQAVYDDNDRPILVRKNSPPLGIPLAAMNEMQDEYSRYVQDLVKTDLDRYVSTAYDDQQSDLPRRLLQAICMFHKAGIEVDDESDMGDMIRLALEMHVTCTILERSLILERESINLVSHYLQQEYPARTAARCAQRQIKLAFFIAQRQRIVEVLRKWGSLMWATTGTSAASANNGHKWVTSFSVFLLLILVMDKTLIAAYYFCEGEIKHHGREATTERRKQASLMRLMQTELFERCKEVFHSRFKTRKAGKESCNPVRDGWKGRDMELREVRLVRELQHIVLDFDDEIKAQRASSTTRRGESDEIRYDDAGRLASIFLGDFLNL